jgi:nitroreductase
MDTLTAIITRQSTPKVCPDPVPRALIEQLLNAAVQAPNHHRVRPWRFVVLTGSARERLGDAMAAAYQARVPDAPAEAVEVERKRPLRAPVLICVGIDLPGDNPRVIEIENVCAGAAAVENLLLAAHALGLAAMWRTGDAAYDPAVKAFLGFSPQQQLIAMVYVGYQEVEMLHK